MEASSENQSRIDTTNSYNDARDTNIAYKAPECITIPKATYQNFMTELENMMKYGRKTYASISIKLTEAKQAFEQEVHKYNEVEEDTTQESIRHSDREPKQLEKLARGCILGAFVGDAAGAVLEFYHKEITEEDVQMALTFPGGGALEVQPGQITDDSEMAMSLMNGLIDAQVDGYYHDNIAWSYYQWYNSKPFDIGNTTVTAMKCIEKLFYTNTVTIEK